MENERHIDVIGPYLPFGPAHQATVKQSFLRRAAAIAAMPRNLLFGLFAIIHVTRKSRNNVLHAKSEYLEELARALPEHKFPVPSSLAYSFRNRPAMAVAISAAMSILLVPCVTVFVVTIRPAAAVRSAWLSAEKIA